MIYIQQLWLNSQLADTLISIQGFDLYPLDSQYSTKEIGGVATYINPIWSRKPEPIYLYSFSGSGS